ncbi:MAG: FKBP-type peptidyl-prolyl cis-trans isomerase [Actinobacteria bacterium]|nr:FKBP-type peptidyl-prolyl cis-trans isomerase [Actinomycetota bacterium]
MSDSLSRRALVVVVAAMLALAACGSSDDTDAGTAAVDGMACYPVSADPTTTAPKVEAIAEAPKEVETEDLVEGDGCTFGSMTYANLNLIGAKADGTVFTDTWADERPLSIDPAKGELLAALSNALTDLEVGGIRRVVLPAADAYGEDGFEAQGIGPNEALSFTVELFSVSEAPAYCREASLTEGTRSGKPETIEMPVEAPTELETEDLTVGTGDPIENGNYVKIEYTGVACSTGTEFDSSYNRDATFDFTVGSGAITGMSDGVVGAKKGGVRRIVIPADQAYGDQGQGDIGPNEPLVFVVTIVDVLESDPSLATTTTAAEATTTTAAP